MYYTCNLKIIYELLNNLKFDLFCLENYISNNKNCLCNIYDKGYDCLKSCKPHKFLDENKIINKIVCIFLDKYICFENYNDYCENNSCCTHNSKYDDCCYQSDCNYENDDCCHDNDCYEDAECCDNGQCYKNEDCCNDNNCSESYNCCNNDCCDCNNDCCENDDCCHALIEVLIHTLCEIENNTYCKKNYGYLLQINKLDCIFHNLKNILCQLKCLCIDDCNLIACTLCLLFKVIDFIASILSKINNIECLCKLNSNCQCELEGCMICELEDEVDCLNNIVCELSHITYEIASKEILNCSICTIADCSTNKNQCTKNKNCKTNYYRNLGSYKNK